MIQLNKVKVEKVIKTIIIWSLIISFFTLIAATFNHYWPLPTVDSSVEYVHERQIALLMTIGYSMPFVGGIILHFRQEKHLQKEI